MAARLLELRRALTDARAASAQAGRYGRVSALDGLMELAVEAPPLARACLRAALEHLDAMGEAASEIEIDRVRTLRDRVAPSLVLGPPIDRVSVPTEMEKRASAALEGLVRGPVPPPGDPDHGEALALTTLAHLVGRRHDVALPMLAQLSALATLPRSAWAVLIEASRTPRSRRTAAELAIRLANERAHDAPRPCMTLAPHVDPRARIALLLAAFDRREPGAEALLREAIDARALAQRDRGDRRGAIAMLEAVDEAIAARRTDALRRLVG